GPGSLEGDGDDDGPGRFAFLESPTDFEERIEQVGARAPHRPDAVDALLQLAGVRRVVGENGRPFAERDERDLVFPAGFVRVGEGGDEWRQRRSHVRYVVTRRLTRVDEHGNLHRLVGRIDAQNLTRDVVLADDEV